MSPQAATEYLHQHIPLTRALAARVVALDAGAAEVSAPLAPNLNHRSTAFGGSLATLGILAGWTLLHFVLRQAGIEARLVIQRSACEYLKPVDTDFTARSTLDAGERERFLKTLQRHRRARIGVEAQIRCADVLCVQARGDFVALVA